MQILLRKSFAVMQFMLGVIFSVVVGVVLTGVSVAAAQSPSEPGASQDSGPYGSSPGKVRFSPLVDKVRAATAKFIDVNVALDNGWVLGTPCVSGPEAGAMGVHIILPSRVGDGVLDANKPEALIYEPQANGALRLVGVEYIVLASDWARLHPEGGVPALDGHLTNFVDEPNRFGLPAFYELHVWAWEHNPQGSFADWNTRVTCDSQTAD
jgi:hypothetical protein